MTLQQLKFQLQLVSLFNDATGSWTAKGSCGCISPDFPASAASALMKQIGFIETRLKSNNPNVVRIAEIELESIIEAFTAIDPEAKPE